MPTFFQAVREGPIASPRKKELGTSKTGGYDSRLGEGDFLAQGSQIAAKYRVADTPFSSAVNLGRPPLQHDQLAFLDGRADVYWDGNDVLGSRLSGCR